MLELARKDHGLELGAAAGHDLHMTPLYVLPSLDLGSHVVRKKQQLLFHIITGGLPVTKAAQVPNALQ